MTTKLISRVKRDNLMASLPPKPSDLIVKANRSNDASTYKIEFKREDSHPYYLSRLEGGVYRYRPNEGVGNFIPPIFLLTIAMRQELVFKNTNGKKSDNKRSREPITCSSGKIQRESVCDFYYFDSDGLFSSHKYHRYHGPHLIDSGMDYDFSRLKQQKTSFYEAMLKASEDLGGYEAGVYYSPLFTNVGKALTFVCNNDPVLKVSKKSNGYDCESSYLPFFHRLQNVRNFVSTHPQVERCQPNDVPLLVLP